MDPKAALKFCNFKGFGEELQGLEVLRNFNLIIGKNNSGKSSVLDLVEHLISRDKAIPNNRWHKGSAPTIVLSASLTEEVVRRVFPEDTSLGGVPGRNHWEYGRQLVGLQLSWKPFASDPEKFQSIENLPDGTEPLSDIRDERSRVNFRRSLSSNTPSPFTGLEVVRISAERRITPEENEAEMVVEGNGTGVSNMIQAFLNRIELDSTLVEIVFLEALNEIFSPEAVFTRIVSQQIDNQKWEIYLEEEYKGRIGLSESGSGLQTVIIVLSHLLLRPVANNKTASDYFFCCEELENNLHPALQRKLLNYLFQKSVEQDIYFFVATHSNVAIDQFANSTNSQIVVSDRLIGATP